MNKSEKLLAARKKLKEFQLHKSNHDQDQLTSNQQNDYQREKVVIHHQQDNNLIMDNNNEYDNSNEDKMIDKNSGELSVTNVDTTILNNANIIENTNPTEPLTCPLDEKETITMIQNDEIDTRNIGESFQINISDEKKLTFGLLHAEKGWPLNEMEMKVCQTTALTHPSNDTDGLTFEMHTVENEVDYLNSTVDLKQNSSHAIPPLPMHINLIDNDTEKSTIGMHLDVEMKNKSLISCLEMERNKVKKLQIQVNQLHNKIGELESLLMKKNSEHNGENSHLIESLKEQIQMHHQAAKIHVTEKADLNATLSQYQITAQHKSDEVRELYEKLRNAMARMIAMEKDLINVKTNVENGKILNEKLTNNYDKLNQQYIELNKVKEEQQMEAAELREDLNIKKSELLTLQQKIEENENLLSLAKLKIQQLTISNVASQQHEEIENQCETSNALLKQQLSQLQENLKSMNNEKEEMCRHYESYVKQLNTKYEGIVHEFEMAQKKINDFNEREESLIQRLSLMEQHYQREKQKTDSLLSTLNAHEVKISHLTDSMASLVLENENLQHTLNEKETEVDSMKDELRELHELRDQSVEISKLVTALESEKLGASRAVSQNHQLKLQLIEMHDALSSSKLNLTEQLQDERSMGRKLNAECNRIEAERDILKEELDQKAAIIEELEKDKLHLAQMADQMQHYQVQSTQTRTLQEELQNALSTIKILKEKNQLVNEKLNSSADINKNLEDQNSENIDSKSAVIKIVDEQNKILFNEKSEQLKNDGYDMLADDQKKLELRFKETMERVAELTDEKQRLEHLVLQLQGETETIGEYITLYQKQRTILQLKAQEKERTFNQLLEERNRQQAQFHQLKVLVAELLKIDKCEFDTNTSYHASSEIFQHNEHSTEENTDDQVADDRVKKQNFTESEKTDVKNETALKIIELLTEIKDCKDTTCSAEPNFHHCLWCSGKLITV